MYGINQVVAFSRFCVRMVRGMIVRNMNCFLRRIRDFDNLLVLGEMSLWHAKIGNGRVHGAASLNIHDTLGGHASVTFGHVWIGNYHFQACCLFEDYD